VKVSVMPGWSRKGGRSTHASAGASKLLGSRLK